VEGKSLVNPKPVTGLEAIGRGDDRNKLIDFLTTVQQALGPEAMAKYINVPEALARLAASESIDTTNLVKTADELAAEDQAAQEMMQQQQQQEMLQAGIKSPAMGRLADGYVQQQLAEGGVIDAPLNRPEGTGLPA
jgi:hypothetical protein